MYSHSIEQQWTCAAISRWPLRSNIRLQLSYNQSKEKKNMENTRQSAVTVSKELFYLLRVTLKQLSLVAFIFEELNTSLVDKLQTQRWNWIHHKLQIVNTTCFVSKQNPKVLCLTLTSWVPLAKSGNQPQFSTLGQLTAIRLSLFVLITWRETWSNNAVLLKLN